VEVNLALAHLPEFLRRALILAMYTGQRISDLVKMRWSHYDGVTIKVRQRKTGAYLVLPAHDALKKELDAWLTERHAASDKVVKLAQRRGDTILLTDTGVQWTAGNLGQQFHSHLNNIPGFPKKRSLHGVRYFAATSLAQAGCTAREIMAVTGHRTLAMVQKYTDSFEQEQGARSAMTKWQAKGGV
jgi:integrase